MVTKWKEVRVRDAIWFSPPPMPQIYGAGMNPCGEVILNAPPSAGDGLCIVTRIDRTKAMARNAPEAFYMLYVEMRTANGTKKSFNVLEDESVKGTLHRRRDV